MQQYIQDTIAAIATPPGNGGVGIIRISGPAAKQISQQLSNKLVSPRQAVFTSFKDEDNTIIDSGILLYFPNPASYTGEDTIELQGHGGSVVLGMLLKRVLNLGARLANPGEFTERAFLNNKLDLAQAEAVADLIESSTEQSVRSAQKSMQGVFSEQINELVDELTELRIYVEAAIDFVDEEIDFLSDGIVENKVKVLIEKIHKILKTAQQGRLLRDGMTVVLAGKPNAGKSSLLNALAGHEAAIVTEIAGTTRDTLKERIQIDGMPLHIIDTAGLRESDNVVEKEGIRRAHEEIKKADKILTAFIDTLQTLPSFVYLIPVVMLFRVGDFTAMIAVILYALAPAVRYTAHGVKNINNQIIEAALICGCSPRQLLFKIKLPLAIPEILLGINQTIMLALSMLVITALVGTRDLGQEVYIGLTKADIGRGLIAGLCVAFISIIADRIIKAGSNKLKNKYGIK